MGKKGQRCSTQLTCQLDAGATCNVTGIDDLSNIYQDGNPPVQPSKVNLKLFDGSIIKPVGETTLDVIQNGKADPMQSKFQVVKRKNTSLWRPVKSWDYLKST